MKQRIIHILILTFIYFGNIYSHEPEDHRMDWFREARFGMFIHWGVYSVLGGNYEGTDLKGNYVNTQIPNEGWPVGAEWIMRALNIPKETYKTYAQEFTASDYNPEMIVNLAKNAGMKYIIITAKHHEGLCMFPTEITDWNVMNTPAKKDLLKPLVEAAHKAGLKIGFYFSQNVDWMCPGGMGYIPEIDGKYSYEEQLNYVEEYTCPLLEQLLTNYEIDILWYDIPGDAQYKDLANKIDSTVQKHKKPELITNNRLSPWHPGDYGTPEQSLKDIPWMGFLDNKDWELCFTMNASWGYVADNNSYSKWQDVERISEAMVEAFSKGGNALLNIGPN